MFNRTERMAEMTGHNERWSDHVCGFKMPQYYSNGKGEKVPESIARELEELNREASDFPPIEIFLK